MEFAAEQAVLKVLFASRDPQSEEVVLQASAGFPEEIDESKP
jgi:hypothetical protein